MEVEISAPFEFWSSNPKLVTDVSNDYDSVVIVSPNISKQDCPKLSGFIKILLSRKEADDAFEDVVTFAHVSFPQYDKIKKLVYSPTGPLNRDYDDVRRFADASLLGIKRILKAGGKQPLLAVLDSQKIFKFTDVAALLGAAEAIYVPMEIRCLHPDKSRVSKVHGLGFTSSQASAEQVHLAAAIESGRVLCRDIGGSDPEFMAPPAVADYVEKCFSNTCIKVEVISDESVIEKWFPLLAAVNRAARGIKRHQARVILLTYVPEGPYDTTVVLVGKGVTYDTGGADVKAGGIMAGMHRDKCGSAAVAGFFQTLAVMKPQGVKVMGAMSMVRNSIGSDCYVSDEIITSRAGKRIRIGNTDAEGRMAMGDVLCYMKEKVIENQEKNPFLFTIATLTGHACLAFGDGYSGICENGPAKLNKVGSNLQKAGDEVGDMFEISSIRREDYEFHEAKSEYEDLLQCNNLPSSKTPRGHQGPAAFLIMASGLEKHGIDSDKPLSYCHIDIAPSSGPFPGIPSGAPIPALVKHFLVR